MKKHIAFLLVVFTLLGGCSFEATDESNESVTDTPQKEELSGLLFGEQEYYGEFDKNIHPKPEAWKFVDFTNDYEDHSAHVIKDPFGGDRELKYIRTEHVDYTSAPLDVYCDDDYTVYVNRKTGLVHEAYSKVNGFSRAKACDGIDALKETAWEFIEEHYSDKINLDEYEFRHYDERYDAERVDENEIVGYRFVWHRRLNDISVGGALISIRLDGVIENVVVEANEISEDIVPDFTEEEYFAAIKKRLDEHYDGTGVTVIEINYEPSLSICYVYSIDKYCIDINYYEVDVTVKQKDNTEIKYEQSFYIPVADADGKKLEKSSSNKEKQEKSEMTGLMFGDGSLGFGTVLNGQTPKSEFIVNSGIFEENREDHSIDDPISVNKGFDKIYYRRTENSTHTSSLVDIYGGSNRFQDIKYTIYINRDTQDVMRVIYSNDGLSDSPIIDGPYKLIYSVEYFLEYTLPDPIYTREYALVSVDDRETDSFGVFAGYHLEWRKYVNGVETDIISVTGNHENKVYDIEIYRNEIDKELIPCFTYREYSDAAKALLIEHYKQIGATVTDARISSQPSIKYIKNIDKYCVFFTADYDVTTSDGTKVNNSLHHDFYLPVADKDGNAINN